MFLEKTLTFNKNVLFKFLILQLLGLIQSKKYSLLLQISIKIN